MRASGAVLRAALCGFLSACEAGYDVVVQDEPDSDVTSYTTFAFAAPQDDASERSGSVKNALSVVNDAAEQQLSELGLHEVSADAKPDVIVFTLVSTRQQTDLAWSCLPAHWYGNWPWAFDPCEQLASSYTEYKGGSFALGLVDPALDRVVFAGMAIGALVGSENDIQRLAQAAVKGIFDKYPKPVGSRTGLTAADARLKASATELQPCAAYYFQR